MDFATVFQTFQPAEAHLVRSRLEAAGIPATVVNEHTAAAIAGAGTPAVPLRVEVAEAQAADARALIDASQAAE